jgi:hypothetical protein
MAKPKPGQRKAAPKIQRIGVPSSVTKRPLPAGAPKSAPLGSPGITFQGIGNAVKQFFGATVVPNPGSAVIASAKRIQQATGGGKTSSPAVGRIANTIPTGKTFTAAEMARKLPRGARNKVVNRKAK